MRRIFPTFFLAFAVLATAPHARAQGNGPMTPPPKFQVHRISNIPHPGPPPIPADQIIQKFTANEDVMKKEYQLYDFSDAVRIEESGNPPSKFTAAGEVYNKPDGQRYFRVTKPPEGTLKSIQFSLEDVHTIMSVPLFVLTTDEVTNYDIQYVGDEKLDELHTYVFRAKPKQLNRKRRFFDGLVWVDDHDFAIVKSYGKFVSEIESEGTKLPFTMFETFRENFQDKYWLPTYTRSDDYIDGAQGDEVHLHLVIHATDFRLSSADAAAPPLKGSSAPGAEAPAKNPHPNRLRQQ